MKYHQLPSDAQIRNYEIKRYARSATGAVTSLTKKAVVNLTHAVIVATLVGGPLFYHYLFR